jgi:hypothetical protein
MRSDYTGDQFAADIVAAVLSLRNMPPAEVAKNDWCNLPVVGRILPWSVYSRNCGIVVTDITPAQADKLRGEDEYLMSFALLQDGSFAVVVTCLQFGSIPHPTDFHGLDFVGGYNAVKASREAQHTITEDIYQHPVNKHFVDSCCEMPFRDLPSTAQDALIYYMSVEGAAWAVAEGWPDWKWGEDKPRTRKLREAALGDVYRFRARFVWHYGAWRFGYTTVSAKALWQRMEEFGYCPQGAGEAAAKALVGARPDYLVPTWPVILSTHHGDVLDDGWKRLAGYARSELPVPVVWFAVNCRPTVTVVPPIAAD